MKCSQVNCNNEADMMADDFTCPETPQPKIGICCEHINKFLFVARAVGCYPKMELIGTDSNDQFIKLQKYFDVNFGKRE